MLNNCCSQVKRTRRKRNEQKLSEYLDRGDSKTDFKDTKYP